jgi:acid phosphatase (class A)
MKLNSSFAAAAALTMLHASLFAAGAGAPANAQAQAAPPATAPSAMPRPRAEGYLGVDAVPDHRLFLPPPPAVGSPAGVADVAIFRGTRALEGGPRWQLAASDDRIGSRKMLGDFGCPMGIDLAGVEVPALARTLARANADLIAMVGAAKDHYRRPRPFVTEAGPICVDVSPAFAASGSYPSGHSAAAWLYALLLAEIDPGNAASIVARGRAFGESRVVCGVHYETDVEGGRLTTTALVAALHADAEFEADIAAARAELAKARTTAGKPDPASCPADAALATPW